MNHLENLTPEEAHSLLVLRAGITEDLRRLNKETHEDVFVVNYECTRHIHMTKRAFWKFAELLNADISKIINTTSKGKKFYEHYFTYELFSEPYKVFCIEDIKENER